MAIIGSVRSLICLLAALVSIGICETAPAQSDANRPSVGSSDISHALPREYQQWLDEDVRWIITPQERAEFVQLTGNEDRDRFIEEFWKRRDPTPNTAENEFKEEHYRRIAFANMHFGCGNIPGWETDRGRIYIFYGPPDSIKAEPVQFYGPVSKRAEVWHYNLLEHIEYTSDMNLRFIDFCGCGDYRLQGNPTRLDMPRLEH